MHYNCLIVDDEKELAKMTCEYLEVFGVSARAVQTAQECFSFFEEHGADLLLLDINLEKESGFDICRRLREKHELPILFISARDSDDDVLMALHTGGDDYIKKPYSLSILLAKVKVILKRLEKSKQEAALVQTESFALHGERLMLVMGERQISLKAREFALLYCLYAHRGTIVTKEQLFAEVWGDAFYSDSTLNVHIRRLREKIEENPNDPKLIRTVWGTGYILEL
ncbi:MAG: response regulator transcription factor [Blautia sp.]|nr:response regulator transcription factor [Blautia sp.]